MKKEFFGVLPTGEEIYNYTIYGTNTEAEIINYGAAIRGLKVYGVDVVGGFDALDSYLTNPGNHGGTIGRVSNRIEDASFLMDGVTYNLKKNNREHCLHGGVCFNHAVWEVISYTDNSITLRYVSPDGECGFPGELETVVCYAFDGDSLVIDYKATPKSKTPIALTNHAYFNLDGFGGDILSHKLTIYADRYTETNKEIIPTGNRPLVYGTVFDFTQPTAVGERLSEDFKGYDHNFILTPKKFAKFIGKTLGLAAELENGKIKLSVYTDQPGIQLYTAAGLGKDGNPIFKGGIKPVNSGGLCLETQTEPNGTKFGECFYDAGKTYTHTCVYSFEKI